MKTFNSFKRQLDKLLKQIPDTPPTPGYSRVNTNSILEWGLSIPAARVEMIYPDEDPPTDDDSQAGQYNTAVTPAVHGES